MRIDGGAPLHLEAFRRLDGQEGPLGLARGPNGDPEIIATGRSSEGRSVSWVNPAAASPLEQDIVARFLDAVSSEFGSRISANIARELGLKPESRSLDARTVEVALRMGEAQRDVFSGVNFALELQLSGQTHSSAFIAALADVGGPAIEQLDRTTLEQLDAQVRQALSHASSQNQAPLSPAEGEHILREVLARHFGPAADTATGHAP